MGLTVRIISVGIMLYVLLRGFISCASAGNKELPFLSPYREEEKRALNVIGELECKFLMDNDSTFLDSALIHSDRFIEDYGLSTKIVLNRMVILGIMQRYNEGFNFSSGIDASFPESFGPRYKDVIELRFHAMALAREGNIEERDRLIREIVDILRNYLDSNHEVIDTYLRDTKKENLLQGPYFMSLCQYFQYLSYIEDGAKAKDDLDKYLRPYKDMEPLQSFIEGIIDENVVLEGFNGI